MSTNIRKATPADLPEIRRLLIEAGRGDRIPARETGRPYLIVTDAPDGPGLAAAALVSLLGTRACLSLLVVDRRYQSLGLEDRVHVVVRALCRVFGIRTLDIATGRDATGAAARSP